MAKALGGGLPLGAMLCSEKVANSFKPGDIISTRKGISVEIGNTDAEGRLILADALTYACEERPDLLIDCAILLINRIL